MKCVRAAVAAGGASLIALSLLLSPALATSGPGDRYPPAPSLRIGSVGSFTPAVADPRLAAALARRGQRSTSAFRFTPAAAARERNRSVRLAVRARTGTTSQEATRTIAEAPTSATPVTAVTPSSYNLGVSLGWRRFAISGDVAQQDGGTLPGRRESARVDVSYQANRRLTGRVQVSAERAEGSQRIVTDDRAVALDVGGSFSIARNLDVSGGLRYRIARDRLEPLAEQRRESQAVYIGTALRF